MLRDWLRLFSKELLVKKTICTTKTNVYTFFLFKKKTIAEVQPCVWSDRKVPFCYKASDKSSHLCSFVLLYNILNKSNIHKYFQRCSSARLSLRLLL